MARAYARLPVPGPDRLPRNVTSARVAATEVTKLAPCRRNVTSAGWPAGVVTNLGRADVPRAAARAAPLPGRPLPTRPPEPRRLTRLDSVRYIPANVCSKGGTVWAANLGRV